MMEDPKSEEIPEEKTIPKSPMPRSESIVKARQQKALNNMNKKHNEQLLLDSIKTIYTAQEMMNKKIDSLIKNSVSHVEKSTTQVIEAPTEELKSKKRKRDEESDDDTEEFSRKEIKWGSMVDTGFTMLKGIVITGAGYFVVQFSKHLIEQFLEDDDNGKHLSSFPSHI